MKKLKIFRIKLIMQVLQLNVCHCVAHYSHSTCRNAGWRDFPVSKVHTLYYLVRMASTTLSDHVWKLKKKNINFNIKWVVVKRVKPFAPSNKVCGLCLQEKLSILMSAPSLTKRSEIFGHCIHRKKFLLSNLSMSTHEVSIADRNSES